MSGRWETDTDRRQLFRQALLGGTGIAFGHSAAATLFADDAIKTATAKAKRVIFLFMGGGPSQMDMLEYKPDLIRLAGQPLPDSVRDGQRLTTMTSGQSELPIAPSAFRFSPAGHRRHMVSELLPHFAKVIDDVAILHGVHTDAINHDPAMTFLQTGHQLPGRPSAGSWVAYGLGSENDNLPTYAVLHSRWSGGLSPQPIFSRLWGSGFLPSRFQGVGLRSQGDPVLYLSNPPGVDRSLRRLMLDRTHALNQHRLDATGDAEIATRMTQYEMAFRMQSSVPELTDLRNEDQSTLDLYGPNALVPGTFASNCLLARRMAERGVRFTQVFHRGWDQHGNLPKDLKLQCGDVDQPMAGLITDLKRRGLLRDTLVIWGGEFGRTVYSQGDLTPNNYGRDHHPRCFTMWMAGGGVRPGITHGRTDDFSYNVLEGGVHVHDLNATMLHLLGIDHEKLTHRYQGRDFRLTDVHGRVVHEILTS